MSYFLKGMGITLIIIAGLGALVLVLWTFGLAVTYVYSLSSWAGHIFIGILAFIGVSLLVAGFLEDWDNW